MCVCVSVCVRVLLRRRARRRRGSAASAVGSARLLRPHTACWALGRGSGTRPELAAPRQSAPGSTETPWKKPQWAAVWGEHRGQWPGVWLYLNTPQLIVSCSLLVNTATSSAVYAAESPRGTTEQPPAFARPNEHHPPSGDAGEQQQTRRGRRGRSVYQETVSSQFEIRNKQSEHQQSQPIRGEKVWSADP